MLIMLYEKRNFPKYCKIGTGFWFFGKFFQKGKSHMDKWMKFAAGVT